MSEHFIPGPAGTFVRFSQNDKQPKNATISLLSRFQIGRNNGTSCACSLVRFIGRKHFGVIVGHFGNKITAPRCELYFNLAAILGTEYETVVGADNLATELSLSDQNWNGIGRWNWRQITKKLHSGLNWFVPVEQVGKVDFGLVLQEIPVGADWLIAEVCVLFGRQRPRRRNLQLVVRGGGGRGGRAGVRFELHNLVNLQKRRIFRRRLGSHAQTQRPCISDRMESVAG